MLLERCGAVECVKYMHFSSASLVTPLVIEQDRERKLARGEGHIIHARRKRPFRPN